MLYYIQQITKQHSEAGMEKILNYIGGEWIEPEGTELLNVINPATGELLGHTPMCGKSDVETAARAACEAMPDWRRTPVQ